MRKRSRACPGRRSALMRLEQGGGLVSPPFKARERAFLENTCEVIENATLS